MAVRIEKIFLVSLILLGFFFMQSSKTYADGHLHTSSPEGQRAVWSFYKSMRDIQAIQKKAPQSLKQLYDPMINISKSGIQRICKRSKYIYTGNRASLCDRIRAGFVCRVVTGKDLCKTGRVAGLCNSRGRHKNCWPSKYR